jgi:hypothetical protein
MNKQKKVSHEYLQTNNFLNVAIQENAIVIQ